MGFISDFFQFKKFCQEYLLLRCTLFNLKIHPFAILWSIPIGIHDSISLTEHTATLLTSLVQIKKRLEVPENVKYIAVKPKILDIVGISTSGHL